MENCLIRDFEYNVVQEPNKPAILYTDKSIQYLTYSELNDNISLIVNVLKQFVNSSQCLAILAYHHPCLPVLIFGALKSEIAFILLDPLRTAECNKRYLDHLQVSWLLCFQNENHRDANNLLLEVSTLQSSIEVRELAGTVQLWKTTFSKCAFDVVDICYVICTSGTTGEPKYIRVSNNSIYSNVKCLKSLFNITNTDIIYLNTAVTFDPIFIELFLSLCGGASLKVVSPQIRSNPKLLLKKLFLEKEESITFLQIPPSMFLRWSEKDIKEIILSNDSSLRVLVIGGEAFNKNILSYNRSKNITIYNIYGVTEVSCWASILKFDENYHESSQISLGKPLDCTILEIRNNAGDVLDEGEGELYVGSDRRICLINEEKAAERVQGPVFRATGDIVWKMNGDFFYLHRKNEVFKRFGTKISLTQIEHRIKNETHLQCSCIYLEDISKLILFVTIKEQNKEVIRRIKDKLRVKLLNILERNAIPDFIEILPLMPLTSHGKIDKNCLKHMFLCTNDTVLSKREETHLTPFALFTILCSKYLGLGDAELLRHKHCTFCELGGNSITLLQLVNEFKEEFCCDQFDNCLYGFLTEKSYNECLEECMSADLKFTANKKRVFDDAVQECSRNKIICVGNIAKDMLPDIKITWKYDMEACVDATPCIFKIGNNSYLASGSFSNKFSVVNAENGFEIFSKSFPNSIESSPAVSASGKQLFLGCYDGFLYCVSTENWDIIWSYRTGSKIKCTPCLCLEGKGVVVGSYDHYLHCVSEKTGEVIWKTEVEGSVTADPKYNSQLKYIYVGTLKGTFLCISETDGAIIWKQELNIPIFGAPTMFSNRLEIIFADVKGFLTCLDAKTGHKLWNFGASGHIYSSLIAYDGKIYFGCHDKHIYCLQYNETNKMCQLAYKMNLDDLISTTPCIFRCHKTNSDVLVSATNSGKIYFVDCLRRYLLHVIDLGSEIFSSPIYSDSKLYIGCRDNYLYCIDIQ